MEACCEVGEPERLPLVLEEDHHGLPTWFEQPIDNLRSIAKEELFAWKEFPVNLPESILNISNSFAEHIFLAPEFDECEALSKDSHGNLKHLDRHQLTQLRQTAQFDVPSANFVGEFHTWKLSPLFLRGTNNIRLNLHQDLYKALKVLVIDIHDRMVGETFSIRSGFSSLFNDFLVMLVDLLFGWPHVNHGDVDHKLLEERLRFIICELSVKSSQRKKVMDFWDSYEEYACLPRDTAMDLGELKHPPYQFITPARIPIDLRLHNSALLEKCLLRINELRHPARVGWFQDFKENAISRYQDEGKSLAEIKRLVRQEGLREYASRLFDALRRDELLKSVSTSIAEPLIQQATFNLILAEAKESFTQAWLTYREKANQELCVAHKLLYHIDEWRLRQMDRIQREYFELHRFDVHEAVLAKCLQSNLDQHAFFVGRDLTFLRDRERLLREQLEKGTSYPDTQFIFRVQTDLLRYWKVYEKTISYHTNYQLVDTVLLRRPPSAAEPVPPIRRSVKRAVNKSYELLDRPELLRGPPRTDLELGPQDFEVHVTSPKRLLRQPDLSYLETADEQTKIPLEKRTFHKEFVVQSSLVYKTSTRYFLWRWLAFLVCTYTWLLRFGQLFFITIPFRSTFSFTVLFQSSPIYPKLNLDPATGYLYPDKTVYRHTLISLLRHTWTGVRTARRQFDMSPSGGMLDKTAARPWHWIWSYVFRGFLTTVLLLLFWPPLCLTVSTLSILVGFTLPVVVPIGSLFVHTLGMLFWDAYKPASKHNRLFPVFELVVGHFLVRFVIQTLLALLTAFVLCPIWSVIRLFWAFIRFGSRSVLDAVVFHLIIRNLARVPAREDFMVKRIAGPGTAANHFYQARPVHILVLLVGQLELLELRLWQRQMEKLADKPLERYRQLIEGLAWLSVIPKPEGELYATLTKQTKLWRTLIQEKVELRSNQLQIHVKPSQLRRIKLCDRELHQTLKMGNELTECFYLTRIAPRLGLLEEDPSVWWSGFSLNPRDYLGLCTNLLGRVFGEQIFTCIVETDHVFPLQVSNPAIVQDFQVFLMDIVSRQTSVRSLDTVGLPGSPELSARHSTNQPNDRIEESQSISSEAFPSDRIPERCTVIAAGASARDGVTPIGSTEKGLAVSFMFPESMRTTQRRAVTHPVAYVHIELPLFPLSAFTPSSCRRLPLPLTSYPALPRVNGSPCLACTKLEQSSHMCICPTKTELDRQMWSNLLEKWAVPSSPETADVNQFSGMATLLADEEHDLRRQHGCWTWSSVAEDGAFSPRTRTACGIAGFEQDDSTAKRRPCLWSSLFGMTSACPHPRSPVITAVEHLGRVYHPAILTLLMHARDREHNPLDFTHPAIQRAVSMVTAPKRHLTLLRRLRNPVAANQLPSAYPYPTLLALSVGSQLARESMYLHSPSLKGCRQTGGSLFRVSSNQAIAADKDASQSLLGLPDRRWLESSPMLSGSTTVKNEDRKNDPVGKDSKQNIDPLTLFGWNETSAIVGGYWSGTDTAMYGNTDPDSTTASLYGTEDAVTTDDLDETRDTFSLSSVNQCDIMDNLFVGNFQFFGNKNGTQPVLPLAVPEVLTTSATTGGSGDAEAPTEAEVSNRNLQPSACTPSTISLATEPDMTSQPTANGVTALRPEPPPPSNADGTLKSSLLV